MFCYLEYGDVFGIFIDKFLVLLFVKLKKWLFKILDGCFMRERVGEVILDIFFDCENLVLFLWFNEMLFVDC